jgi:hypothetical protein
MDDRQHEKLETELKDICENIDSILARIHTVDPQADPSPDTDNHLDTSD